MAISTFSDWIRVYAEKLVNAPKSHKIEYAPMHTIRAITRLAQNARRVIGYVVDRCPRRQFQTLISQIMQINLIFYCSYYIFIGSKLF